MRAWTTVQAGRTRPSRLALVAVLSAGSGSYCWNGAEDPPAKAAVAPRANRPVAIIRGRRRIVMVVAVQGLRLAKLSRWTLPARMPSMTARTHPAAFTARPGAVRDDGGPVCPD